MAGKATGERIPGRKYRAIVEAAGIGDSINRIARKVGVTWRTVKAVVSAESREIAERKQAILELSLANAELAAAKIRDNLENASLMEANAVFGTSTDKIALLSRDPDMIIKHEHLHYHPRQHQFSAFTRDKWDEILAQLKANEAQSTASQSTLATQIAHSLSPPEQQDNTDTANAAPSMPVDASNTAPAMHSHSQPDGSKKAR